MQDFEGKTAVITGGASGMGLAMAESFARAGMDIVLADVEEGALKAAAERIEALGNTVLAVPTDVANEAAMDHLGLLTRERFGAVDVLCLNAGVAGGGGPTHLLSTSDWKWAIDVNLYGIVHGLRVFLGDMRRRDSGDVVITASVAGLTSFPGSIPYNATKHAAVSIAEGLFSELAEAGSKLRVHCLCPGIVATQIHRSERNRPKELGNEQSETAELSTEEQRAVIENAIESLYSRAKQPSEVAELVLAAIVEERFWIQTDGYYREPIRARHHSIENDTDPPARGSVLSVYE
ncbi:MAG: SDR family NAD(P)-dependent oxidoreductase [Deltaproteobacteria bacterium]|nr:SDR family NAD(P)-dependent oxidoreductase [Deltaproteobacteria bacterium]